MFKGTRHPLSRRVESGMIMRTGIAPFAGDNHGKKTADANVQVLHGLPADVSGRLHQGIPAAGADAPDRHFGFSYRGQRVNLRAHDLGSRDVPSGSPAPGFGR